MCLSSSRRSTTSAGVPGRPRVRLFGQRRERLVDDVQQFLVPQHLIDLPHPRLPQSPDFLLDQAFCEGDLRPGELDHLASSPPTRLCWSRMANEQQ